MKWCEREIIESQCSLMSSIIHYNKLKNEFNRHINKINCVRDTCVVATTKNILKICEWEKSLEEFKRIH